MTVLCGLHGSGSSYEHAEFEVTTKAGNAYDLCADCLTVLMVNDLTDTGPQLRSVKQREISESLRCPQCGYLLVDTTVVLPDDPEFEDYLLQRTLWHYDQIHPTESIEND